MRMKTLKKKLLALVVISMIMFAPVLAIAQVAAGEVPEVSIIDLIGDAKSVKDLAVAGSWLLFAQAIVMLLCDLLKLKQLGGLFNKIPARWRLTIPIVLGAVGGVLLSIASGVPIVDAILGAVFIGGGSTALRQALVKMVMGRDLTKTPSQPIG